MAKLPELCEIQYGYAFDSACFTENNTYLPLVRIRDVKRGYSETFYSGNYPSDYVIDSGSLLVGMDGEFNIARWKGGHALLNQRVCKITAKEDVNGEYIRFALSKALKKIENRTAFVTVKHLSAKELNQLEIDVPNYTTQTDIAKVLTQIESIISARQQQLQKLDELVKARFVEIFGDYIKDDRRPLSEVAIITGGLTKNSNRNTFETKMPYLRVANVFYNRLDLREILEIGVKEEEIEKTLLQAGDLLFVEGNGSIEQIGRVAIWDGSIDPILHQNHLIKARFNNEIIAPEYALFYFMLQDGRQQIISKSVSTSGLNTLSVNKVSSLLLPIPPIALQKQFGEFFKQTDKSKVAVQKALDEAQMLFDSLMQKYFE